VRVAMMVRTKKKKLIKEEEEVEEEGASIQSLFLQSYNPMLYVPLFERSQFLLYYNSYLMELATSSPPTALSSTMAHTPEVHPCVRALH
jgi:hypothetical protein